jgi:muramoyltetrapeptide carboxypeptidase
VVGVVAPSGVVDRDRLVRGIAVLEGMGFRVRLGRAVGERRGYLAGTDEARLADLQAMLDEPAVRAVFCARGGYGSQRLVPHLDWSAVRQAPKLIVGYSDATALLLAVARQLGTAVHGPMVADDMARGLTAVAGDHLRRLLTDPAYRWQDTVAIAVRPGRAEGRLLGGCLSVLATTLGTAHAPDTRGTILFLEDVNEPAYRLDRLLLQLRQSGMLDGVAGVVFGHLEGCTAHDGVTPLDVVREHFAESSYPVACGLAAGHVAGVAAVTNMALPFGVRVVLDATQGQVVAREAAVA